MLWDKIKGQRGAVNYLRQSIKKERVVSSYLFHGPEGVGKTLTASVFARALNCRIAPGDGCGSCPDCRDIERGSHPDVLFQAPSSKSRLIVVQQIRQLQKMVYLQARRDNWKVFVIKEADRMNINAQNAFLKTLEEPPEKTILILVTHQPELLLPTIRSRCQSVSFSPWPFEMMKPFLMEKLGRGEAECYMLHCISGGSPGRALRLSRERILEIRRQLIGPILEGRFLSAAEVISRVKSWLDYLTERSRSLSDELAANRADWEDALDPAQRKEWEERDDAKVAARERAELEMIFELIFSWIRDLFIYHEVGLEAHLINQDLAERIKAEESNRSVAQLHRMMEWVEKSRRLAVKASARTTRQLIFENMLIQLGYWRPNS